MGRLFLLLLIGLLFTAPQRVGAFDVALINREWIDFPLLPSNRGEAIAANWRGEIAVVVSNPLRVMVREEGGEIVEIDLPAKLWSGEGADIVSDRALGFILTLPTHYQIFHLRKKDASWQGEEIPLREEIEPLSTVRRDDNSLVILNRRDGSLWLRSSSGILQSLQVYQPTWASLTQARLEIDPKGQWGMVYGDGRLYRVDFYRYHLTDITSSVPTSLLAISSQGIWCGKDSLTLRHPTTLAPLISIPADSVRYWGAYPLADIATMPSPKVGREVVALLPRRKGGVLVLELMGR